MLILGNTRHDRGRLRALVEMWARDFGPSVIQSVGPFDAARTAEYYALLRSDAPKTPVTGIIYLQQKSFFSRGDRLV